MIGGVNQSLSNGQVRPGESSPDRNDPGRAYYYLEMELSATQFTWIHDEDLNYTQLYSYINRK